MKSDFIKKLKAFGFQLYKLDALLYDSFIDRFSHTYTKLSYYDDSSKEEVDEIKNDI